MNAVSSHRPLVESETIARNQLRAKESWEGVFDQILYFGQPESALASLKTSFIDSEQFPTIDRLIIAASMEPGWTAILNADIIVGNGLPALVAECIRRGVQAITSFRYNFDPDDLNMLNAKVDDLGCDFFMTDQSVWKEAARVVPNGYRISHNRWDNWVLGFLNVTCGKRFVDVTGRRLVFHPRHGERKQPHHIEVEMDRYLEEGRPPYYRLP